MLNKLFKKKTINLTLRKFCTKITLPNKIYQRHEYLKKKFLDLNAEIQRTTEQQEVISFIKKEGHNLNDFFLRKITDKLIYNRMYLDTDFEKQAIPYFCHYISLMDKNQSKNFGLLVKNLSMLEIESVQLWRTISDVFNEHDIERFVALDLLCDIFYNFSLWKKPPLVLMDRIYRVLEIHKNSFDSERVERICFAVEKSHLEIGEAQGEQILELKA